MNPLLMRPALVCAGLALAGCASLQPQERFAPLQAQTQALLKQDLQWPRDAEQAEALATRVAELLALPLTADSAVQIALLNHRGLRAELHQLGVADADLVQLSRPLNPGLSLGRMRQGSETEIERGLHLNLGSWLSLDRSRRVGALRLRQTQQDLALQVLAIAAQAREAYYQALAAEQLRQYSRQVMEAAEAGAELARRMAAAGNVNKLRQAREHGFYAEAALSVARAEAQARSQRETLIRALGLWGEQTKFHLPERLPALPGAARELPEVERQAIAQRLDVQAAKRAAELRASELGLSQRTRFINVLELGIVRNSSKEEPTQRGFELSLELPLFDWGQARVARAESLYMQALERTAHTAIQARSEAREAYGRYRSAFDIARHYATEIVPTRQRIADENLLRYNGMLIGVFELLADARAQIVAVSAAIEAQRDFFLAEAELDQALIGPVGASAASSSSAAPAEASAGGH
ncbi:TolC family protein [Paucibacter sp. XJ19-41]|uniref:TolC family protein n=1 Tax=Paucibacter sp. XJ19-41 TaxID=2927824 RepID=UPI00234B76CF|nr:TolC family protein [Paucibacter sp. XJ19-41]MDC6165992.1 TolC family protein [Paucibacter sp. XJ19-41]